MDSRAQPERSSAGYVAATFDGLTLVMDQADVREVREAAPAGGEDAMGFTTFEYDGMLAPVYRLSRSFHHESGHARMFVLIAKANDEPFGLACDTVRTLAMARVRLEALPDAMHCAETANISIAHLPDGIGFHCPASVVATLVMSGIEALHGDR